MPTVAEERQIRAVVRGSRSFTERTVRRLALEVHANLVETTPVDTGWARANWVPKIGEPITEPVGQPGATGTFAAQSAAAAGVLDVAQYQLQQGRIHVTNNVPYIQRLNDGYSRQEPAGFVQRAIRKALDLVL